jgi:hypothetical protein
LFEYVIIIINVISEDLFPIVLRSEILILITTRQLHPITDPVPENILNTEIKYPCIYLIKEPIQMSMKTAIKKQFSFQVKLEAGGAELL